MKNSFACSYLGAVLFFFVTVVVSNAKESLSRKVVVQKVPCVWSCMLWFGPVWTRHEVYLTHVYYIRHTCINIMLPLCAQFAKK